MRKGRAAIYWTLLGIGALLWRTAYGQKLVPQLYFDHLTINEGLSHNTVFDVLQDQHGHIWIATQNGLNKYDGYTFDIYLADTEQERKEGFLGKIITALHEDQAGNLWVGTRKHGLNVRWKGSGQFTNLNIEPAFATIKGFEISSITNDQEGIIWVTTVGAGVLRYHPKTNESRLYTRVNSGLSDDLAFAVVADQFGKIWVATAGFGVNILQENDRFALSHAPIEGDDAMTGYRKTLLADGEHVWLGTEGSGAYRIHAENRSYTRFDLNRGKQFLNSRVVTDMIRGRDSLIYIATDGGGLNRLNEENGQIEYYTYQVGESLVLNSDALYCFWEDRSGNIWIGTYNGGLNVYKRNKTYFEFLTPEMGSAVSLGHRSILAIHQSENDQIWIGTDGGGLNLLQETADGFTFSSWRNNPNDPFSIRGNAVKALFEDSRGQLWVSIFGMGLDVFDPLTEQFRPVDIETNTVWSMAEQKNGQIWLGTLDEGLLAIKPESGEVLTSVDVGYLPNVSVMSVLVDREDQLWVGSADKGLSIWDREQQRFRWFKHNAQDTTSLSNNEIRTIFQDRSGNIWIGTEGGGINRWLGGGRFERLTQADGLLANSVMGITEDEEGFIWVTTFSGISRLDPRTNDIRNFNFRTGKQSNQFNQMAVLSSAEGRLFFGGINGLNTILPEQVKEENGTPSIVFTDLRVFNQSIPEGPLPNRKPILNQPIELAEEIFLRYSDNSFAVEFMATNFTEPGANRFSYQMEGFDAQWQNTALGQHAVNYTNLDPGTYTFKVQYEESQAQLVIHIASPYWQTHWFRLLVVVLVAALILGGGYLMLKRREEAHQQQLLQLKNENLTTEINAQNSKLLFSSAQMAQKNEILTKIKKELKELQRSSDVNLRPVLRTIDRELKSEDYWEAFNQYVEHVDQEFTQKMLEKHPNITQNDLRLCTLLRLNLSTKEIAALLNISIRGVEQSRYRLKKRLDLEGAEDLVKYISTIK